MPIPKLTAGWLPPGLHTCTLDEVAEAFVTNLGSSRRRRLFQILREHVEDPNVRRFADHVVIDGSFVSSKRDPGDIDILLGLKEGTLLTVATSPIGVKLQNCLEGWTRGVEGLQRLLDSSVFDAGSSQYQNRLNTLLKSTRTHEPAEKGCLKVILE